MTTTNIDRIEAITTKQLHHATRTKAIRLAAAFDNDWQALSLTFATNEDESRVMVWFVDVTDGDGEAHRIYEGDKLPDLADLLDACEDLDIDPEGESKEQASGGSVVDEGYRLRYAEVSSNGQTCGDWLAELLTDWCHGIDGFNVEDFRAVIDQNAVDQTGKWASLPESGQKGWIGRYRMNGRQALEKVVALHGVIYDAQGVKHDVPADALTELRRKHEKWIAKQEKLIEAQKAA